MWFKVFAARANFLVVFLIVSIQKKTHRGGAEAAELKILD